MPLLGYVFKESFLAAHPDLAQAFYDASRQAKEVLASDDAAWEALRERMNAGSEAEFRTVRDDFRAGIPRRGPIDPAGADAFLHLMASLGGAALVGDATALPEGLFVPIE